MKQLWHKVKDVIAPALFLTFTLFVFGPLEIYMTNASNFFFDLGTLLVPTVLCFIVSFFIVLLINVLLKQKKLYCSILTYISYSLVQCITLIVIMSTTDLKKMPYI